MKLKPIADKVIVKRHEATNISNSGIYLTTGTVEKPLKGTVVAAGPGWWLGDNEKFVETKVKEGDVVIFGEKAAGDSVEFNDEELLVMSERMIIAVIDE